MKNTYIEYVTEKKMIFGISIKDVMIEQRLADVFMV